MQPNRRRCASLALLVASSIVLPAHARAEDNLRDRLLAAAAHSTLDAAGLPPWHLKLDVTLYDESGRNPVSGTIERWSADNGNRTVFTFGSATRAVLNNGEQYFASHGGEVPALADTVLEQVLRPGPSQQDVEDSTPELQKENFGKTQLDCIMLSGSIPRSGKIALGVFPTYCMDPGTESLRASFNLGSYTVLRNQISAFQGHDVAYSLLFLSGHNTHVAEAKITALETFTPSTDQFAPDASMKASHAIARLSGGIMAGQIIKKVQPVYPASARREHIGGTVVLHAIVGRDGRIRSVRPVSAPDTDLTLAAIDAVRQWTYKPYLLNGEPSDVDTTITVNFNLNR